MKTFVTLLILFFSIDYSSAQLSPSAWLWGRSSVSPADTTSQNIGIATCVDNNGDVIVTGYFTVDSIVFGNVTLLNPNNTSMFVVKYDASGNVVWARAAHASYGINGSGIACDANGNIYVTGDFSGSSASFGSTSVLNPNSVAQMLFVVKYDSNGNDLWSRNAVSTGMYAQEEARAVCVDPLGNAYISGYFSAPNIYFGSYQLTNSTTNIDGFIVKYDGNGNVAWARNISGDDGEDITSLAIDPAGSLYAAGYFSSDTVHIGANILTCVNGFKCMLLKFDLNGNNIWATSSGGWGNTSFTDICIDPAGSVLVTGYSMGNYSFDSYSVTGNNGHDMFVLKYDSAATVIWLRTGESTGNEYGNSICTDASGNIYVEGLFMDTVVLSNQVVLSAPIGPDIPSFVATYSPSGLLRCATVLDFSGYGFYRHAVAVDRSTNFAYVTGGYILSSIVFGPDTLTNVAFREMFIAKYKCGFEEVGFAETPQNHDGIRITPNPTCGAFNIRTEFIPDAINIYNPVGELVYSTHPAAEQITIDLAGYANGLYIVNIVSGENSWNRKLVVQ